MPTKKDLSVMATLVAELEKAQGAMAFKDMEIVREGTQIILPPKMTYEQAQDWLARKREEEETMIRIQETVNTFPLDGAIAFMKALKQKYGWTSLQPVPGFFSDTPPTFIGVNVSPVDTVQVVWGRIEVPIIEGNLNTYAVVTNDKQVVFGIMANVKRRYKEDVHEIIKLTRKLAREESIYRGKAIRAVFPDVEAEKFNPTEHAPHFMDTSKTNSQDLIFDDDTLDIIRTNLWGPILYTDAVRRMKVPLKRGCLLEGPYGTGKTLTAAITAKMSEENGWTFIYVEDVRRLAEAMKFAKMYAPAVVFTEDIDRAMRDNEYSNDTEERNELMNEILNTIDGVEYKGVELLVVLSTNHVEKITKALLRPGRLDAVISVRPPNAETVPKVIRHYAQHMLAKGEDLTEVGKKLAGQIPASIREVVERAKLSAITHSDGCTHDLKITAADLLTAANGMLMHLELLKPPVVDRRSDIEKAAIVIGDAIIAATEVKNKQEA